MAGSEQRLAFDYCASRALNVTLLARNTKATREVVLEHPPDLHPSPAAIMPRRSWEGHRCSPLGDVDSDSRACDRLAEW